MSLFSSKKLIDKLLDIGNNVKVAQQTIDINSVIKNKITELANSMTPSPITSDMSPEGGVDLKPKNMENINAFLSYLETSKIRVNGKLVVVSASQDKELDEKPSDKLLISRNSENFIAWNGQQTTSDYLSVSKPRLQLVLQDLLDTSDNEVIKLYLNKFTSKLNISLRPAGAEIVDTSLFDGFNDKNFNDSTANDIGYNLDSASIKLKSQDLASRESFDAWIKLNDLKIASKSAFIPASNDLEGMLYLLSKRASNLLSKNPNSDRFKRYKDAVQKLALSLQANLNTWTKKDDVAPVAQDKPSGSEPASQQPSGKPGEEPSGQESSGTRTRGGKSNSDVIEEIFARAPLQNDMLDYEAIIDFAEFVASKFTTNSSIAIKAREISNTAYQQMTGGTYFSTKTPDISFTSSYDNLFHSLMARGDQSIQQISNKISAIQKLAQDVFALLQLIFSRNSAVVENNQKIKNLYYTQSTRLANNDRFFNGALQNLNFRKK